MSSLNESEQTISYKPYMVSLLRRLQTARALVSLKIGKDPSTYNSIVINADSEKGELFLDELSSTTGHKKIKKGTLINFDGRLKGVRMQFQSSVLSVEKNDRISMYRLALPKIMTYRQRRRHFRANVNDDQKLAISLPVPLKQHITGDITDLSASGFCSRFNCTDSINLQEAQAIYAAVISLPGKNQITCDIEVRSVRHYPDQGYTLIGSQFIEIQPNQQTHLERIVAMLDRNQRRTGSY